MDLLLELMPTGVQGGFLIGAVMFINRKVDTVKSDVSKQLNNGIKDELVSIKTEISDIQGYLRGKSEG